MSAIRNMIKSTSAATDNRVNAATPLTPYAVISVDINVVSSEKEKR